MRRLLAAVVVLATAVGGAGCFSERATSTNTPIDPSVCDGPTPPAGVVVIRNFSFQPSQVTVASGGAVTWVNCESGGVSHTSTSDNGVWDSGLIAPRAGYRQTFTSAGSYPYHCEPHPTMRATVVVQ